METVKDKLMSICYENYSKDHDISFNDFWDKIINDKEFGEYFDKVLWEQAKKELKNN